MAAETQGLSPEELLKIFCIRLDMSFENIGKALSGEKI